MYVRSDDNTVVTLSGDEYRRATTDEWAAYEAWLAEGHLPQDRFTAEQWAALNSNSQGRLAHLAPA